MQIVVQGLLVHYNLTGRGKLVLMLHGWGDSAQGLAALQADLAKDYRVLALDLPGFGNSQVPDGVWDLDNYSEFIKNLLNKLDLKQPYAVIGHSNGGALALRAVSLGALEPEKLVLMAASGIRTGRGFRRFILKIVAKTGDVATIWLPERYRQALRRSLYGAAGSDMLVMPGLEETFKKTVRQDVQFDAAAIITPTLLIYAADDPDAPVSYGQKYDQLIKDSRLEVIDNAGHFVHHDQPAKVEALIKEFLK